MAQEKDRDDEFAGRYTKPGSYGESKTYTEPLPEREGDAGSSVETERRPAYGFYYEGAIRRISRRPPQSSYRPVERAGWESPSYAGEQRREVGDSSERWPTPLEGVRRDREPESGYGWRGEGSRFEQGGYRGGRSQAPRRYSEPRWRGSYGYREGRRGAPGRTEPWGGEPERGERWREEPGRPEDYYPVEQRYPVSRGYEGYAGPGLYGRSAERYGETREGAVTEWRRTRWHREALTAGEIMTRDVKAVTARSTLRNVAEIMKDENCGIVPVVDEDHALKGVVTDRDIVLRTLAEGKSPAEVTVGDIMTDDVEAVTPEEPLTNVVELMGDKQVRRVPVVDKNDRLLGIISMGDIATRADYDEDLQEALEKVSAKRSFWSRIWS